MAAAVVACVCMLLGIQLRPSPRPAAGRRQPPEWAGRRSLGTGRGADAAWGSPAVVITITSAVGVVMGALLGVLGVLTVVVAAGVSLVLWHARRRQVQRRAAAARSEAVPDLVDLCRVAASAGTSVWSVLEAVAPRAPEPCRPALRDLLARRDRGETLAAGLDGLAWALGPDASALVAALGRSAVTGSPLAPLLAEVAAASHDQRRRQAQEAARRLPVTLLFPLALCVLPAAVVLAVVPVLVVSLRSLSS